MRSYGPRTLLLLPAASRHPGPLSHSVITPFCYYPLLQELGIAVSQWLMTYPQLQRCHQHHCTQRSCWSVSLLLFLGFARLLCVCCFAVVRPWTVFYGSAWGELVHCGIISHALFDHTFLDGYLCGLHLLKIFTRKATCVSVSPGAHLSVRKWKECVFYFYTC